MIVNSNDNLYNESNNSFFPILPSDNNEFSVFFSELDELKQNNKDEDIYDYLIKTYKTKNDEEEFINYFYDDSEVFNSRKFISIGIFEDLSYYSFWMSDQKYSEITKKFKEKYNIYYWRRIKGDGNCFYRSVLIPYLEILLSKSLKEKNPKYFFSFIKEMLFTKFPQQKEKFQNKLITVLLFIYEELKKESEKCFDILYRTINLSDSIEKTLIFWMKIKLVLFLKENLELEVNGIKLIQCIPGLDLNDDMTYDKKKVIEYIDNKLMKMNEYAEGYPLYITPFILKCNLDIYYLNGKQISKEEMIYHKDLMIIPVDTFLPFLNNEPSISILFKSPHYDSLATKGFVNLIINNYSNKEIILYEGMKNEKEYDKYKTDLLEHSNIISYERSKKKVKKNYLLQTKFTESENICENCHKEKTLRLPCGCIVCGKCSYQKVKTNFLINKNRSVGIVLCKCNYIINEKECQIIQQFMNENE